MKPIVLVDYELAVARQGYVVRAMLKLEGKAPDGASAVPLDLSIVLDRSGSMAGDKLARAREAAAFLVRRLRDGDRVSVVAYDDEVSTVAPPAAGSQRAAIGRAIDAIDVGGSTNLSGGWLRGHELVAGGAHADGRATMHRVLLLTDGLANVGITDPARLVALCRAAAQRGVTTSTIGFGADYDEKLLRGMADAGGGNSYYIERPDQAPGVFEEEIEGLLTVAAQNVAVDIRPAEAVEIVAVHNDYPSHATAHGVHVDIGDLYAREPRSLLVELFVPGLDARDAAPIADLTIAAYVLTPNGGIEKETVTIPLFSSLESAGKVEPEIRRELMVLEAARARDEAVERQRRGDAAGASEVLRDVAESISAAGEVHGAPMLEQAEDLLALAGSLDAGAFGEADAKYAAQRAYNARRGKGNYEEKLRRRKR